MSNTHRSSCLVYFNLGFGIRGIYFSFLFFIIRHNFPLNAFENMFYNDLHSLDVAYFMRSVLLTFVFSVPIFLQSADTVEKVKKMTINDALCGAYNHDKNKAAREETEAGHEQYVQARAGMLPTLGLQGNYSDNKKENSGDLNGSAKGPRTKTKRGSVVLSQNIYQWPA